MVLLGFGRLDPDEFAAKAATIAGPNIAVATSLRDAVTSLISSGLPADGKAALAGQTRRNRCKTLPV